MSQSFISPINDHDKGMMQKLAGRELSDQEVFEAKQDLLGAFGWLVAMDRKYSPHLYENHRG